MATCSTFAPGFTLSLPRCAAIRDGGQELHKLLKDTNRKLKVSAGLPDWKNYVDFVNSLVVQGLIKVVAVSLSTLNQQISQAYIVKQQLPPMLELEMHLSKGKVHNSVSWVESRGETSRINLGWRSKRTRVTMMPFCALSFA